MPATAIRPTAKQVLSRRTNTASNTSPSTISVFAPVTSGRCARQRCWKLLRRHNVVLVTAQDPCATAGNTCTACKSVTNDGNASILACPSNQCNREVGGNANLKPEIGDTRTIGVVFTPTFLDGFTATVDYFNIDVSNAIGAIPGQWLSPSAMARARRLRPKLSSAVSFIATRPGRSTATALCPRPIVNTGFLHTKGIGLRGELQSRASTGFPMTAGRRFAAVRVGRNLAAELRDRAACQVPGTV